jgi:hypothetical protein
MCHKPAYGAAVADPAERGIKLSYDRDCSLIHRLIMHISTR